MSFLGTVIKSSKRIYGSYSVAIEVNTETKDGSRGEKTNSFGTSTSLRCAFFKHADEGARSVEGVLSTGDASLLCEYDSTIARDDRITVTFVDSSTETYLVKHVEPPIGKKCKIVELEFSESSS